MVSSGPLADGAPDLSASPLSATKRQLLEKWLSGTAAGTGAAPAGIPRRAAADGSAELSFAQERLWFLDRLDPDSSHLHMVEAIRLGGPLDRDALRRALAEVLRRHEALRTVFRVHGGEPRQYVLDELPLPLTVDEGPAAGAGGEDEKDGDSELVARLRAESQRPFDLARGPLVRFLLRPLGPDDHVLMVTMHHIVGDGISVGILFRELFALYEAYAAGRPTAVGLADLPVQYADFAEWQRGLLRGEELRTRLDYWREALREPLPGMAGLVDRQRQGPPSLRAISHSFALSAEVSAGLRALARRHEATLFMALLAGFQTLVLRRTGHPDVVTGSVVHGRDRPETEHLIGFFANTLALRTDLSGEPSFAEVLRRVRRTCLGAYAHRDTPIEILAAELRPGRNSGHNPLFQAAVVGESPAGAARTAGLEVRPFDFGLDTSEFDLVLHYWETDGRVEGGLRGSADLFRPETVAGLAQDLADLFAAVIDDPLGPVTALCPAKRREGREPGAGAGGTGSDADGTGPGAGGARDSGAEAAGPGGAPAQGAGSEDAPGPGGGPATALPTAEAPDAGGSDTGGSRALTPTEQHVADVWREVLGLREVDVDEDFFEVGGHSLRAVRVLLRLRERLGVDLPVQAFFEAPTVSALAELFDRARGGWPEGTDADGAHPGAPEGARTGGASDRTTATPAAPAAPDGDPREADRLRADAVLDPEISGRDSAPLDLARVTSPRHVLLTGATGLLGAHVLAQLLARTKARVHCLVEAADPAEADRALADALSRYRLRADVPMDRVTVLPGSLREPLLGLGPIAFARLAGTLDAIHHTGCEAHLALPYERLRAPNVGGTTEVLRLAARQRLTPVHYVSSPGVLFHRDAEPGTLRENGRVPADAVLPSGYVRSRWVAEELVRAAREAGVPVTVHRPGRLAGSSATGVGDPDSAFWRFLAACVDLGAVPDFGPEADFDLVPVDYVASAVVDLSLRPQALDGTFHLAHPTRTRFGAVVDHLRALGYDLAVVDREEWARRVTADVLSADADTDAYPGAGPSPTAYPSSGNGANSGAGSGGNTASVAALAGASHGMPGFGSLRMDVSGALAALAGSSVVCPPVDGPLLDRYLGHLIGSGLLAPPPGHRHPRSENRP
ncbi:thioester reductase domain-containing protein [Streptomyces sp. URMC 123]|uniref:thioester reductase domain-containing protein n=1 Tax=Streptomyces sp. URMC 123 TaxID=3423403 RepID=UPI003F1C95F2